MPPPISVVLIPYDPAWPERAAEYGAGLGNLGSTLVAVHHIGSTAVPGLAAKPVIDLIPVVTSLEELDSKRALLGRGYDWHGEYGIAGRRYCTLSGAAGQRVAQFHFFASGSPQITRHLAFRDYLRAHPDERRAYEDEKRRAHALFPDDSHGYGGEKAAWIDQAEVRALAWFGRWGT